MRFGREKFARVFDSLRRDDGQALVEYALILALVTMTCVAALTLLGGNISSFLTYIGSQLAAIAGS